MRERTVWVLTLFPDFLKSFGQTGVTGQALQGKRKLPLNFKTVLISDYAPKGVKDVDDSPYGGGPGMVMRADVLKEALFKGVIEAGGYGEQGLKQLHIVYPSPRGPVWNHQMAQTKAHSWFEGDKDLVFICGRYQGIDERFLQNYVDEHISLGEFVLSGGELAVIIFLDSCLRLVPGILGNSESCQAESYRQQLLECPHYTRPAVFEGLAVPEILTSGHHHNIEEYRNAESLRITRTCRPDLLKRERPS